MCLRVCKRLKIPVMGSLVELFAFFCSCHIHDGVSSVKLTDTSTSGNDDYSVHAAFFFRDSCSSKPYNERDDVNLLQIMYLL